MRTHQPKMADSSKKDKIAAAKKKVPSVAFLKKKDIVLVIGRFYFSSNFLSSFTTYLLGMSDNPTTRRSVSFHC